jgi:hypothetical protein
MARWIRFFTQSSSEIEQDDLFPALLAEAHPLPPATATSYRSICRVPVTLRDPAVSLDALRQERVA